MARVLVLASAGWCWCWCWCWLVLVLVLAAGWCWCWLLAGAGCWLVLVLAGAGWCWCWLLAGAGAGWWLVLTAGWRRSWRRCGGAPAAAAMADCRHTGREIQAGRRRSLGLSWVLGSFLCWNWAIRPNFVLTLVLGLSWSPNPN
ncbi:hypothetical protein PVL29_025616 [Vitis rotundifolia]|uniref:Uncharacterized protein n=1 Tax=Vitis rotundifolia TaxID=103349 RepID=A0AA38YKC3_VITRO|nr:hypothetical protein PVL29_025616 [Vitis rotundifolia]